jgi:hypothetical protein
MGSRSNVSKSAKAITTAVVTTTLANTSLFKMIPFQPAAILHFDADTNLTLGPAWLLEEQPRAGIGLPAGAYG